MEFLFSKYKVYKLQPSALRLFKILENSWDNVCWGILFYRSRCVQSSCSEQLFEKVPSILKKVSNMEVLMGSFQKLSKCFPIFQNADGHALPKIKTSCSLEHQSREISNCAEIVSVCKWYWCRITKQKKEYWGVSDVDVIFFPKKKFVREK